MRKWVAAFTAICITAAVGGVWIFGTMRRQAKAVEVTGTTLVGDERAADGLILETVYELQWTYWSTVTEWTADGPKTEAQYRLLSEEPQLLSPFFKQNAVQERMDNYLGRTAEYWWNVYGRPVSNGGRVVDLPLSEVTKYEPLKIYFNMWSEVMWDAYEAEDKINEFLRITVPEWQKVRLSHTSEWDADFQEMIENYSADFFAGEDWYYPTVESVYTGEKLFFAIDNRSKEGQILDFSDTPGGYGVYMLPLRKVRDLDKPVEYRRKDYPDDYRFESVDVEYEIGEPSVVLPLDPQTRVYGMSQSEDLTKVFVLTIEDGRYVATVIDAVSLRVLAHIDLCEEDTLVDQTIECHAGENFGAIYFWASDQLFILYPYGEEDWRPIRLTGFGKLDIITWNRFRTTRLACDGERTAVCYDDDINYSEHVYLAVFDKEKPVYAGKFCNSLEYANRNENLASIAGVQCEDFRIRWKE